MHTLKGKTALITGGTTGIGFATAKLFLENGARIAITGLDLQRLEQAKTALGGDTIAIKADVCSVAELADAKKQTQSRFGRLDVLFANAGVAFATPLDTTDEARYEAIMGPNLRGVFFTVQQFAPLMGAGGSIVLNTSWLNEVGTQGLSLLSASKAAVRSLARTLSAELQLRGIRVNAVSPGAINTPIHGKTGMSPEQLRTFAAGLQQRIPLQRFGNAEEIAAAALFLASDASSYMLGAEIVVDGGFSQL
jgi:NAD(P)-dependent dehydrogenase (short-subunit alcohol dehydrogenase family)